MPRVCQYFQTNSCRFGSSCRNRHVYENHEDVYDTRKPSGVSVLQRNKYVVNNTPAAQRNTSNSGFFSSTPQRNTSNTGFFSSAPHNTGSFNLGSHPAFRGQQGKQQPPAYKTNIFGQALNDGNNRYPSSSHNTQFVSNTNQHNVRPSFQQSTSVFGGPMQNDSAFKQNLFGGALEVKPIEMKKTAELASQSSSQSSFQNINSLSSTRTVGQCSTYSQMSDLTPEELKQYEATTFTYGKTPLKCPPMELC